MNYSSSDVVLNGIELDSTCIVMNEIPLSSHRLMPLFSPRKTQCLAPRRLIEVFRAREREDNMWILVSGYCCYHKMLGLLQKQDSEPCVSVAYTSLNCVKRICLDARKSFSEVFIVARVIRNRAELHNLGVIILWMS